MNLCQDGHESCRLSRGCTLYGVWKRGQERMLDVYRTATLDQLAMAELKPEQLGSSCGRCRRGLETAGMIRDPMQALERDLQAERASALARINDLFMKALEAWEAVESGQLAPLGTRRGRAGAAARAPRPHRGATRGCCWFSASRWDCVTTANCYNACRRRSGSAIGPRRRMSLVP